MAVAVVLAKICANLAYKEQLIVALSEVNAGDTVQRSTERSCSLQTSPTQKGKHDCAVNNDASVLAWSLNSGAAP